MKNALVIWIWLCAYLNCAGWALSAIHQLNAAGYGVALAIWVASLFLLKRNLLETASPSTQRGSCLEKSFRRFKRPLPFAFLFFSVVVFLGGAIYAPSNYDGLAYRLPRVLNWLAADQWHWIHTLFPRLNTRACSIEWMSAPLIALFKTDRLLFLLNFISFAFLPGLIFSVLSRLGVRRRVAWHWMWIFPSGYCFLLQAGSIANDAFGAPFALAAVDFALRSRTSKSVRDLFSSILAVALLTGAKTSNLPLLLPWAIAILPSLKLLLQRPIATAVVCFIAVFASFVPTAVLNYHYDHDWSGLSSENIQSHGNTVLRTGANIVLLGVLNLTPPVFPEAGQWNQSVQKTLPPGLELRLQQSLTDPGACEFLAPEMQIEENAGLGFGLALLLVASVIAAAAYGGKPILKFNSAENARRTGILLAPWISTLAILSKSEIYAIGRILAPYYPLWLPLILAFPGQVVVIKKTWWRAAVYITFAMALGLLIISPARPLFPAGIMLQKIEARHSNSKILARIDSVYSVYRDRGHAFAPALAILPPNVKTLGLITYDDPETSLWLPFGSRRVIHVCPEDKPADLKALGIEYILARGGIFGQYFPDFDDWLKTTNAQLVQKIQLNLRAGSPASDWYLVKLN